MVNSVLIVMHDNFHPKHNDAMFFENHLNNVMLVFIR